jgi:hypothetical protein
MAYTIQAIISDISIIQKLKKIGLPCVAMPFNMAMIPLTYDYVEKNEIPFLPLTDDGGTSIGNKLKNLCEILSESAKVAYIEAEYFGGEGIQACNLYSNGLEFEQPLISMDAINHALQWLGIDRTDEMDEFDNFGLGTHRDTEDWIN